MTFQDAELERRICDNHKKHTGQSPAEVNLFKFKFKVSRRSKKNHLSIYYHQHRHISISIELELNKFSGGPQPA